MDNERQIENEPFSIKAVVHSRVRTVVLVVGIVAAGVVMGLIGKNQQQQCGCLPFGIGSTPQSATSDGLSPAARPRLLDLGATKCIPCKKMAPILEELKQEYAGRMDVEFIDVWQNQDAANQYGIQTIPTQIFFDAAGKELYRHEGFFAKEDILKKWGELGIELTRQ